MLLSEGASPAAVVDGLDDMVRRMQQIPGGWARPDSWAVVQNSYLQLVVNPVGRGSGCHTGADRPAYLRSRRAG